MKLPAICTIYAMYAQWNLSDADTVGTLVQKWRCLYLRPSGYIVVQLSIIWWWLYFRSVCFEFREVCGVPGRACVQCVMVVVSTHSLHRIEREGTRREALPPLGGTRMGETHLESHCHDGMFHSSG